AWTFLFWGYLHGALLCVERLAGWPKRVEASIALKFFGGIVTFYFVAIAFVFFRAADFDVGLAITSVMLGAGSAGTISFGLLAWAALAGFLGLHFIVFQFKLGQTVARWPAPVTAALCGLWLAVMLPFVPTETVPFIYFQF
ncbi:MAG: hypothetical protein WA989_12540, partial [Henriciella sp.]